MNLFAKTKSLIAFIAFVSFSLTSCSDEKSASLFDANEKTLANPTISTVAPTGVAVAGIDTVTVQGTGFSNDPSENTVYFNASPSVVIRSTTTEIKLIAPLLVSDSVAVRVAVRGSFEFSNKISYRLRPAVEIFGDLDTNEQSTALSTDSSGNLYSGLSLNSLEAGILKFTPSGVRSSYALKTGGDWTCIRMGPSGYVYAVRNIRAVYRFPPNGGTAAGVWVAQPSGVILGDFDFDENGSMWAGGDNSSIYKLATDKTVTTFPFVGQIHSFRVFNGYLYFAAKTSEGEKIWRAQLTAGVLGTPEVYFNFASVYPSLIPLAITFSSDGDLYIGMDSEDGILVVTPGKKYYTPLTVYKQLFGKGVKNFAWGNGDDMYCNTVDGLLLRINVTGKKSAPYYGSLL